MQILLTLNSGLGVDTGPNFNLTANVGTVIPSSATKSELLAGILVTIDDAATQVTVTSVGTCTTSLNISVTGITTSTTTSSPASFTLGHNNTNFFTACTNYTTSPTTYYATNGSSLIVGTTLYDNAGLTTLSGNGYYSNGTTWWRITLGDGVIASTGACATTSTTSTSTTSTSTSTTTTTIAPTTTTSTTTTTAGPAIFSLGYDASVGWQSCYATQTTYYGYTGDTIQNNTYIFTDSTLSTKAPVGYYSNGTNYYYIASTCNEYTFTNNLGYDESVSYYDCSGTPQTLLVYDGTTSSAVCVDAIINLNGLTANNNGLGSCTPNSVGILENETPCPTTSTTSTTSTSTTTTSTSTTTTSTSTTTTEPPTTTSTTTSGGGGTTSTTSTTTLSYTTFLITYSNTSGATACTDYATPTNRNPYYAGPGATLGNGTVLYTTSALTTPVANGYYSDGTNYWNTAASSGMLANQTVCAGVTTSTTTTTTTTTQPPTTTTTTTTIPPPSVPTVDTCGGTATFAIVNNATGVNVGYTVPTDGSNSFITCTLTGSPLSPGDSDSFIGAFGPSYSTVISGAGSKQLRTWVGSTLFSTITLTGTSNTINGDASFGSSFVILEIVN